MVRWRRQANEFATSRLERQTAESAMSRNAVQCDQPVVHQKMSTVISPARVDPVEKEAANN